MAKDRIYAVSFRREANNMIDWFVYHLWAQNAPEAKRLARKAWETRYAGQRHVPHMFWLEAHRADAQDVADLRVKNWLDREITGDNVMYSFFMTRSNHRGHFCDR